MHLIIKFFKKFKLELLFFVFFVLLHLPDLGHDMFNTDVWKWKARSYDFGSGVFTFQPEKTLQKYHPGVTLMWVGAIGVKLTNFYINQTAVDPTAAFSQVSTIFLLNTVQDILVVLVIGLTLALFFNAIKHFIPTPVAFLGVLLLSAEPFYLALTRTFHLEGLMTAFMLASIGWLYYFYTDQTAKRRFYLAAVFGAAAFLTKTSSLYLLPFVGLTALIYGPNFANNAANKFNLKQNLPYAIKSVLKWIVTYLIVAVIIWPAAWYMPWQVLETLYQGIYSIGIDAEHIQYFFGQLVDDPGYFYYFVVFALRTSIYVLPGLIGFAFIYKKLTPSTKKFAQYLIIYAIFYFIQVTIVSKKLDRYIIPSISAAVLLVAMFYYEILQKIKLLTWLKYTLFFVPAFVTIAFIHYDYFSYYNPLFGGLQTGIRVLEPKWMIGNKQVMAYFKQKQQENQLQLSDETDSFEEIVNNGKVKNVLTVGFPEKYYTQIWPFFREIQGWAVVQELSPFAVKTKYFVYPVWADDSYLETRFKIEPIGDIKLHGVSIYNVYQRVQPTTP